MVESAGERRGGGDRERHIGGRRIEAPLDDGAVREGREAVGLACGDQGRGERADRGDIGLSVVVAAPGDDRAVGEARDIVLRTRRDLAEDDAVGERRRLALAERVVAPAG